jgi:hypothetical protein
MDKKCATCALFIPQNNGCARTRLFEAPENSCTHWIKEIPICSVCNSPFIPPINWVEFNGEYRAVCDNCRQQFGKCPSCSYADTCDFKSNPINIPHMITKTVKQGNGTLTTQVINPARIAETCAKNCKCYCEDGCNKSCGTCGNYNDKWNSADIIKAEEDKGGT